MILLRVYERIKNHVEHHGIKQNWVVQRMNEIDPSLKINEQKFSASLNGNRTFSSDELACFCLATNSDPRIFIPNATNATTPDAATEVQ